MFCPKCGSTDIDNATKRCKNCGADLSHLITEQPKDTSGTVIYVSAVSKIGIAIYIVSTLILLILFAGIFTTMINHEISATLGFGLILGSLFFYFLALGIGTICNLLKTINSKLK